MPEDFEKTLRKIDQSVRAGQATNARPEVQRLMRKRLPRALLAPLASLARRVGLPELAITLLRKYVRPSYRSPNRATDPEKAEYAASLARMGLGDEAYALLADLDAAKIPRVHLYRAFALANQWRYRESISPLERYLASRPSTYQTLVGKTNLAAALVFTRESYKTAGLLRSLLHETSVRKHSLLHANALELSAEYFLLERKFDQAERCLREARELLAEGDSTYGFLLKKWALVLDYLRGKSQTLDELRALARQTGHSETLRDADRFTLLRSHDSDLATRLYFGTPYESFRERLRLEIGPSWQPPADYLWYPAGQQGAAIVDLMSGEVTGPAGRTRAKLRTGHLPHRLLVLLASDFYRAFRVPALHAGLHPNEYFHPEHSVARVQELVRVTRAWIRESRLPVEIALQEHGYFLKATGPVAFRLVRDGALMGRARATELEALRARWPERWFQTKDAEGALGLPRRTLQRLLREATESGTLEKIGNRGGARYRFRSAEPSPPA